MAMSAIKPASVAFVQTLFERHNVYFQLEELTVSSHSSLANKALRNPACGKNTAASFW
ncbi:hypothetical protein P378_06930 [Desulforamulus profundi]|uniref:Uncharacterized protein n=1 Tax=Desulforamulus profundi TaxID=1383067 RepID=A0A2C6LJW2_9FIRM|nr:hypothetical protein [Desulforamulus profundi]PHJ38850.1 hypothetical protein P378_06930 [Desulforamulus profundi]